jgi:hypothetical protein
MSGLTLEMQLLPTATLHNIFRRHSVGVTANLAGEVTTLCLQRRVVEGILAIRDGLGHEHVGVGRGRTEDGDQEGFGEHHVDEEDFFVGSTGKFEIVDPIRTRRKGSNGKGLDVGSRESGTDQGFLRQKS